MDKSLMETLVARAEQKAKSRTEAKEFDVPSVGKLLFVKPSQAKVFEFFDALTKVDSSESSLKLGIEMIYECCPTLQDSELHEALGVVDPLDAVPRLMDVWAINKFAGTLSDWIGLTEEKAEQTVKNS